MGGATCKPDCLAVCQPGCLAVYLFAGLHCLRGCQFACLQPYAVHVPPPRESAVNFGLIKMAAKPKQFPN
jgi:hypothetical protein